VRSTTPRCRTVAAPRRHLVSGPASKIRDAAIRAAEASPTESRDYRACNRFTLHQAIAFRSGLGPYMAQGTSGLAAWLGIDSGDCLTISGGSGGQCLQQCFPGQRQAAPANRVSANNLQRSKQLRQAGRLFTAILAEPVSYPLSEAQRLTAIHSAKHLGHHRGRGDADRTTTAAETHCGQDVAAELYPDFDFVAALWIFATPDDVGMLQARSVAGMAGMIQQDFVVWAGANGWRSSEQKPQRATYGAHESLYIRFVVVNGETRPDRARDTERFHQRLTTMMAGS